MPIKPTDVDLANAAEAYTDFLKYLGVWETMDREAQENTPLRVARTFKELFGATLPEINFTTFDVDEETAKQVVFVGNLEFASLCAHHHLPFSGVVHVAYYPGTKVCGLSKIPRVVEMFTHGALIQEECCAAIASCLLQKLEPKGVAVWMEAEHTCMAIRGVRKPEHTVITQAWRGIYCDEPWLKEEFISLVKGTRRV